MNLNSLFFLIYFISSPLLHAHGEEPWKPLMKLDASLENTFSLIINNNQPTQIVNNSLNINYINVLGPVLDLKIKILHNDIFLDTIMICHNSNYGKFEFGNSSSIINLISIDSLNLMSGSGEIRNSYIEWLQNIYDHKGDKVHKNILDNQRPLKFGIQDKNKISKLNYITPYWQNLSFGFTFAPTLHPKISTSSDVESDSAKYRSVIQLGIIHKKLIGDIKLSTSFVSEFDEVKHRRCSDIIFKKQSILSWEFSYNVIYRDLSITNTYGKYSNYFNKINEYTNGEYLSIAGTYDINPISVSMHYIKSKEVNSNNKFSAVTMSSDYKIMNSLVYVEHSILHVNDPIKLQKQHYHFNESLMSSLGIKLQF